MWRWDSFDVVGLSQGLWKQRGAGWFAQHGVSSFIIIFQYFSSSSGRPQRVMLPHYTPFDALDFMAVEERVALTLMGRISRFLPPAIGTVLQLMTLYIQSWPLYDVCLSYNGIDGSWCTSLFVKQPESVPLCIVSAVGVFIPWRGGRWEALWVTHWL